MARLQERWRNVLATFFPRWKAGGQWRCRRGPYRGGQEGHCDEERRVVTIYLVSEDDDALDMLLIHEVCHAVTTFGHAESWRRRMAKAAAAARSAGRTKLAVLLDAEIELYRSEATTVSQAELYGSFVQGVAGNPTLTYEQAKRLFAADLGMSLRRVDQAFPRLRKHYNAAKSSPLSQYLIRRSEKSSTKTV